MGEEILPLLVRDRGQARFLVRLGWQAEVLGARRVDEDPSVLGPAAGGLDLASGYPEDAAEDVLAQCLVAKEVTWVGLASKQEVDDVADAGLPGAVPGLGVVGLGGFGRQQHVEPRVE